MRFLLWLSLLLIASHALTQDACVLSMSGVVIDEHDGKPLAFAAVLVAETGSGVIASESGRFQLADLCAGEVMLTVSHTGCEPVEVLVLLTSDTTITIYLEHHRDLLEMVEVEAQKPHDDIASRTEVSLEKLETNEGQSLAELLEDLQGVQALRNGGNIAKPMIHGLHSNRIVIVHQDTRVEGQQWGGEHAPELDPLTSEELEVVQGASSLRYGPEALAGVIVSKSGSMTRDTSLNGWAHFGAATNGRRGTIAGKVQGAFHSKLPLFFQLQGTLGRGGDLNAPDYILDNTGIQERNFQARLHWSKPKYGAEAHYAQYNTDVGILSYAHIGNLSDLERALEQEVPIGETDAFSYDIDRPNQHVEHELSALKGWWTPRVGSKLEAKLSRQYNLRQEFDRGLFSDENPDLQYEITTWQTDLNYTHRWNGRLKSELGMAAQNQSNTIEGRFFIPNFEAYRLGAYAIQHLQFAHWEVEAGVRFDQHWLQAFFFEGDSLVDPEKRFSGLSWNLGFSRFSNGWSFASNLAQGWRSPSINELYSAGLHHGAASVEFGNDFLKEERLLSWTNQFSLNERLVFGRAFSGSVTAYANYFDQFIYLVPTAEPTLTIRGAFPTFEYQSVEAFFRGIDFSARYDLAERWKLSLGGEVVRANDLASGDALLYVPADRFDLGFRFRPGKRSDGFYFGLGAVGVLTQTRYPRGVDYAPPPEGYALFSAEMGTTIHFSHGSMILSFRVENLTNQAYRSYLNRLRYFADEPGRNFIFSLRIPFTTT